MDINSVVFELQIVDIFITMWALPNKFYNLAQISTVIVILSFFIKTVLLPETLYVNMVCIILYLIGMYITQKSFKKHVDGKEWD